MKQFKILLLIILSTLTLAAQTPLNTKSSTVALQISFDSEDITVDNTSGGVGFTSSKINPTCASDVPDCKAQLATCVNSVATISILTNTTQTVTTTVGLPITTGQSFTVVGYDDISHFKAIRTTGSSATLHCQYSKPKFQ